VDRQHAGVVETGALQRPAQDPQQRRVVVGLQFDPIYFVVEQLLDVLSFEAF
jgi:hypothetical protein